MLSNDPMSADLLRFYDFYTGPGRCGGRANRWEYTMQRYRSGHNGADSKSEWMPEIVSKIVIINKFL